MPITAIASPVVIYDGENAAIVGRMRAADGTYLDTINVLSFDLHIYDRGGVLLFEDLGILPGGVFEDTLIIDQYSSLLGDSIGRNFLYVISPSMYTTQEGGGIYPVEFVIHTSGWGDLVAQVDLDVRKTRSL